jgi:hypothetical protein
MSDDKPQAQQELETCLTELLPRIDAVDAASPDDAMAALSEALPFDGPDVQRILGLCRDGIADGWLVPRSAGPSVLFGRLAKDMGGYAVDTVVMEDASGLGHTHTRGEINMCFALNGEPRFDGHAPGWVVFPPGSHHVPTVEGGTMLFIYFTPGGEVEWDRT